MHVRPNLAAIFVLVLLSTAVGLVLSGCAGGGFGGAGVTTGAITAPRSETADGMEDTTAGVEVRAFAAGGFGDEPGIPNAYGVAYRQLGGSVQTSVQVGWMVAERLGSTLVFARLMVDGLAWQDVDGEKTLSAFSPTFDVGFAPFGRGICITASGNWDVHFNAPDRGIVGAFVGLCGGPSR